MAGRDGRGSGSSERLICASAWLSLKLNLAAVQKDFPNLDSRVNSKLSLFYISCGLDDFLIQSNREYKEFLKSKDIHFVNVETPGYAHVWSYWRKSLVDLAPQLF